MINTTKSLWIVGAVWCVFIIMLFPGLAGATAEGRRSCIAEPNEDRIQYGDQIDCTIDPVGDSDLFKFTGKTGETVWTQVVRQAGGNPCINLFRPDGTVFSGTCQTTTAALRATLDQSGDWKILVREAGDNSTMAYVVMLERISPIAPTAIPVGPGDIIEDQMIAPIGDIDLFFFDGVSGDTIRVQAVRQAGGNPCINLFRPDGAAFSGTCQTTTAALQATLDQSGDWIVMVREAGDNSLMTYNFEYQCITGTCPALLPPGHVGVYRPGNRRWYLDDGSGSWSGCGADQCAGPFGSGSDLPFAGSWNDEDSRYDEIGVFNPSTRRWFLDNGGNTWSGCGIDSCLGPFGQAGDWPVAGDWDNDGFDEIGVFRPGTGRWSLDDGDGSWSGCSVDWCLGPFGSPTDRPVGGDWDGDGLDEIGVFRPSTGRWYLDYNGDGVWSGCGTDRCLGPFGGAGDRAVAGDWDDDGVDEIGVYRPGNRRWYLDNGNGSWNGCAVDQCLGPFGSITDRPVGGNWK